MATIRAPYLYKETRLNLDPPYHGSTISISLPGQSLSAFAPRAPVKRTVLSDNYAYKDDEAFARRHLATEASVYFRPSHRYPRSFLWRILDSRRVLEIQSMDLSQDHSEKNEAILTLSLSFPSPIRPFGVAFAEPDDRDAVNCFVLTDKELYTLNLHRDFFCRAEGTETDVGDWCKICSPSSFVNRTPYKLVATSALELLVSLHDGGLLRLSRSHGDDGSLWRETLFTDGGWSSSFRSLIAWKSHNSIRFNNLDLEPSAAADIVLSPNRQHVFTVCLNHTLQARNLATGKVGLHTDLLGENDYDLQKSATYSMTPSQPRFLQVLDVEKRQDGDLYYVVTYSEKRHQFKFWGILDPDASTNGIRDIQSEFEFIPPIDELMDTTVWTLEEFHVKARSGLQDSELWIRARSGPSCKVFSLRFSLFVPHSELRETWKHDWACVDEGALTVDALRSSPGYPPEPDPEDQGLHMYSSNERWLDFLFYPGRFTTATLETALSVFRSGSKQPAQKEQTPAGGVPLKERLCQEVASKVALQRTNRGEIDYDQFELALGSQWQVFYGLVRDLHKRRGEVLALVFDDYEDIPWLLQADYISAIRTCSEIELLYANQDILALSEDVEKLPGPIRKLLLWDLSAHEAHTVLDDFLDVSRVVNAARVFRNSLSAKFQGDFGLAVKHEVLQDPSQSISSRITRFDERCHLIGAQVTDEDDQKLEETLADIGGLESLDNDFIQLVIDKLGEAPRGKDQKHKKNITNFGRKVLIRGAQETLQLTVEILYDLLVLVVYLDQNYTDLNKKLDPSHLFNDLVTLLREHAVLGWLASNIRQEHSKPRRLSVSNESSPWGRASGSQNTCPPQSITLTLLESIFIGDWADLHFPDDPRWTQSMLITYWCRAWTFGANLSHNYDDISAFIMGNLMKHCDYDLASEFLCFLRAKPWSTYLRARLFLEQGEHALAAIYFKKAAFGLAAVSEEDLTIADLDSAEFLDPDEHRFFGDGMWQYYRHVSNLFEKMRVYSYASEFASMALQAMAFHEGENPDARRDILSRLFETSLQTGRFEEAYSALTRFTDPYLRRSTLKKLIEKMVNQSQTPAFLGLPFARMHNEIDEILSDLCKTTLNIATGPPYHKVLYAFRIAHNDFRGAAGVLYERLQRLSSSSITLQDPQDETLTQCYLMLINLLASVDPDQAWILVDQGADDSSEGPFGKGKVRIQAPKRRIVTLEDVRKEYQLELDRIAAMESGKFEFGDGDEMDVL